MELQIKNIMQQQGRTNQWLADQFGHVGTVCRTGG